MNLNFLNYYFIVLVKKIINFVTSVPNLKLFPNFKNFLNSFFVNLNYLSHSFSFFINYLCLNFFIWLLNCFFFHIVDLM